VPLIGLPVMSRDPAHRCAGIPIPMKRQWISMDAPRRALPAIASRHRCD
jgi:hypothetical protein